MTSSLVPSSLLRIALGVLVAGGIVGGTRVAGADEAAGAAIAPVPVAGDAPAGVAGHASPPVPAPVDVLRFDRDVDAPVLAVSAFAFLAGTLMQPTIIPRPVCDPCDASGINPLDRWVAGRRDTSADGISYATLAAVMAAPLVLDAFDVRAVGGSRWTWLHDFGLYVEALALDAAVNTAVKLAVARPRPLAYDPSLPPDLRASSETYVSFYSLHTSFAFTAAAFGATTFALRHARRPGAVAAVALVGALLAGTTAALRVVAGRHFPTDVGTGALVGTAVGVGVPLLHRVRPGGARIAVAPIEGGAVASVGWIR